MPDTVGLSCGTCVAIIRHMVGLMRFTAIALCLLVFAVVFSVCGEAVACGTCGDACCLKADRTERRDGMISRSITACSERCTLMVRFSQAAVGPFVPPPGASGTSLDRGPALPLRI